MILHKYLGICIDISLNIKYINYLFEFKQVYFLLATVIIFKYFFICLRLR